MDPNSSNFADLAKKYKVSSLAKDKPKMRYYPNAAKSNVKMSKSYEIYFKTDQKDFSLIEEEIQDNYEHKVNDILQESFNQFVVRYAKEEQKNVIYYLYRSD